DETLHDSARLGAMLLPGIGFTSASCSAYRRMKGVMRPGVSAGSKNVGASVKWVAHVICPSAAPGDGPGASSASASAPATMHRARWLIGSSSLSRVQDDLQRVTGARFQHRDGVVDTAERELVRDERLGREPPGGQQRQRAADAGAALAALGVDRDVAPDRVAHVGGDGA